MIMKKPLLFAVVATTMAQGNQQVTVVGKVVEKDSNEPIVQATVQLLSLPDSTMVIMDALLELGLMDTASADLPPA